MPIADAELDQLVTQASNDNIPLIDAGLLALPGTEAVFSSTLRRLGMSLPSEFVNAANPTNYINGILVVRNDKNAPNIDLLKAAKALFECARRVPTARANGIP